MSRRAVIVSTARTGLAKSFRGGFNATNPVALAGHCVQNVISRAGNGAVAPSFVEDVILGCAMPEAESGMNVARNAALWGGCPVETSGVTINRFCSSGLQAVAMAAHSIVVDNVTCAIGGGVDSISLVQPKMVKNIVVEKQLYKKYPALWMPMIETADIVAERYNISRKDQDEYSVLSQDRTAAAQKNGLFDTEIVPMNTKMGIKNKETGEITYVDYTVTKDECNRPGTTIDDITNLVPIQAKVNSNATITAGNASQLSDGASACLLMEEQQAKDLGLNPLGAFMGFATAGCAPDEMGIGPIHAVPKLLKRFNMTVDDIDLW